MVPKASLSLLFFGIVWLAGCTGGSFTSTTAEPGANITAVAVSCNPNSLQAGQTGQCTASMTGIGNFSSGVTWSAASGTVTNDGIYTAPSNGPTSGADTVTATSIQNPRWDDNDVVNLDSISSSNLEVVQVPPSYPGWDANSAPTGAAPTIDSFTRSATTAGTSVTLT